MGETFNPLSGKFDIINDDELPATPADPTTKFLNGNKEWATPAGGGGDFNVDGGLSNSTYDQVTAIDGGTS
jgi:hypothetical protein